MKIIKKIYSAIGSPLAMGIMFVLYIILMALATFIEKGSGTAAARSLIYNNWWFYLLQLLLVINFVSIASRFHLRQQRKWGTMLFHYAFAVILLGAMVTHLWSTEGIMHIREGESSNRLLDPSNGREIETLPFSVALRDFRLVRYPGSNSPSSFESDVTITQGGTKKDHHVYMNNVLYHGTYRLYQSSYDPDEQGTVLTVNRDMVGTMITYFGYIILMLGMILSLVHPASRFRTLARKLGRGAAVVMLPLALLFVGSQSLYAQGRVDTLTLEQLNARTDAQMQHAEHQAKAATSPMGFEDDATAAAPVADPQAVERLRQEKIMAKTYAVDMAINPEVARAFGSLMIQNGQGRVEPIDTYAAKILRKIYRSERYLGLNADQALLGMVAQPFIWSRLPIIKVGSEKLLAQAGGGEGGFITFVDVLDPATGDYIYQDLVEKTYAKPVRERNQYDKEVLKLDEKVNILNALFAGQMLSIFPHDGTIDNNNGWYSPGDELTAFDGRDSMFVSQIFPWFVTESQKSVESGDWSKPTSIVDMIATYQEAKSQGHNIDPARIRAEMLYNQLNVFKWSAFLYMGFGIALVLVLIARMLNADSAALRRLSIFFVVLISGVFLWQSFGIGLRWYISERAPWSNAYESMVYVGWATALAGIVFARRSWMTLSLAAFFAGVILLVSTLNWMDPEITPLVPVLKSPWLLVHVAVITGSYGFFGIGFLLGLISMIIMIFRNGNNAKRLDSQISELVTINEMALTIGVVLLTAGTFLGAVWANESWGRYWGWDPKETWALITMIVYAFVLHARFIPRLRSPYAFSLMSVVGLAAVLMTFFGVNYYLSGMHSYGGDSAPPALSIIYWVYGAVVVVAVLAFRRRLR